MNKRDRFLHKLTDKTYIIVPAYTTLNIILLILIFFNRQVLIPQL